MSTSLKIFIFTALIISNVYAGPPKTGDRDFVAAEKAQLRALAKRKDLPVREWLKFVDDVDNKCTNESNESRKNELCSLYYQMFEYQKLFVDNPSGPTWEQCVRAGITAESLAVDDSVKANVKRIADKLCPKV